jgi:hypothetical protein
MSTRPVYPRVEGTCRLIEKDGKQYLVINGKYYRVEREYRSYRLVQANGTVYNVSYADEDEPRCDCPDITFRDREDGMCKHIRALIAEGLLRERPR